MFFKMVDIVINYSPFFIFCLLAGTLSKLSSGNDGFSTNYYGIAFSLVVLIGLLIMALVIYPLLMRFFIRGFSYRKLNYFSSSNISIFYIL